MRINFDPTLEAHRLARIVIRALCSNSDSEFAEAQVFVSKLKNEELEALAAELEEFFWIPFGFQPYARVMRSNAGAIKAINFYPGWLDIINWGKEIKILTYRLSYDFKQKV